MISFGNTVGMQIKYNWQTNQFHHLHDYGTMIKIKLVALTPLEPFHASWLAFWKNVEP